MELAKFEIKSFSDNEFKKDGGKKDFQIPINPESFTRNLKVERDTTKGHGNNQTNSKFVGTAPEELKIEFILDGTGTMEGYLDSMKNMPVKDQLKKLIDCVYDYDGKIHSPRYLKMHYGSELKFDCVLTSLDINHTLFNADGSPLRAKITANFLQYVAPKTRAKKERNSSPDLTHQRIVKAGDRLDLLTFEVYDSPAYLLQVALKNGLTNVRNIKPGLEIFFHPFDKSEA
jgi:Contractile injection system tube protein